VIVQIRTDHVVPAFFDYRQPGAGFLVGIGRGGWDEFGPTEGGVDSVSLAIGESLAKDAIKVTRMADTKEHILVTVDLL